MHVMKFCAAAAAAILFRHRRDRHCHRPDRILARLPRAAEEEAGAQGAAGRRCPGAAPPSQPNTVAPTDAGLHRALPLPRRPPRLTRSDAAGRAGRRLLLPCAGRAGGWRRSPRTARIRRSARRYPPAKENCRNTENFEAWKARFRKEAAARGVSRQSIAIVDEIPLSTQHHRARSQAGRHLRHDLPRLPDQAGDAEPRAVEQAQGRRASRHVRARESRNSACPLRSSPASGRWRATSARAWGSSPFCRPSSPSPMTAGAARCSPRS